MNKKDFMISFLEKVVNQDELRLASFFKGNAEIIWPCTNEKFTVSEYVEANCKYPGCWKGQIIKFVDLEKSVVMVSRVYTNDVSFFVTSFISLNNEKIQKLEEYWSDIGDAPSWRQELNIGKPLRN